MIKIKESKYKECIICGEKSEDAKDVGINRFTGQNLFTMCLCTKCLHRMAAELTLAAIGEENLITNGMPCKMVGHSGSILEKYYQG